MSSSLCVLIFLSRGYFMSEACLREARTAVKELKQLIIVHEPDANYGGVSMEQIESECPDDLRPALLHDRSAIIRWLRLPAFRIRFLC